MVGPMAADRIVRDALSISVATSLYATTFGVLSIAAGFSVLQTCAMSALAFTGASQFAYVSVVAAGGSASTALPPALLLGARNAVYGLSLEAIFRRGATRRAVDAHLVIDESTAMAHAQDEVEAKRRAFLLTSLLLFVFWNGGTLVGALGGRALGDPATFGLDAIFPAVFVALLAPQLRRPGAAAAVVGGAAVALALLPFAAAGVPIVAAALVAVPVLVVLRGRRA